MRIGVTGSSGFLGSHLTKALGQLPDAEVNRGTDEEILIGNIETTFNLVKAAKKTGKQ